ncbi:MAG: hypothetical protein FWG26_08150 [Betaproteobacteria bacterium]|nr:hypothetical protein [Betaproteobacteria bacterium]
MFAKYVKIGFLLLIWAVVGTSLCTFILTRLQYVKDGAYLLIPSWLVEAPVRYFFYGDLNYEEIYDLFWLLYGFLNLVAISLIIFAGYCAYKYFKKPK